MSGRHDPSGPVVITCIGTLSSDHHVAVRPSGFAQDFGNFQIPDAMAQASKERQKFGRFYYRFPNGEAGTDVFDRMSDFISTLFQSMDATDGDDNGVDNYVLVTHGLLMRIFCMCYLRWTVDEFNQVCTLALCLESPGRNHPSYTGCCGHSQLSLTAECVGSTYALPCARDRRSPVVSRFGTRPTARSGSSRN